MIQEWELRIQTIYLNSRRFMRDTPEDWEKVFECFRKVLDEYDNAPQVMEHVQAYIVRLEKYLKGNR